MTALNMNDIQGFATSVTLENQSVSTAGGGNFKRELLPPKNHPVRLVGYVELGSHEQTEFQMKAYGKKPPSDQVEITFEVLSKDGIRKDEEGKVTGARRISFIMKKSMHEKAGYRKLFDRMRGGDAAITHMTQMIGTHSWLLKVTWSQNRQVLATKSDRTAAETALAADPSNKDLRIWENFKADGAVALSPAVRAEIDSDGEETGDYTPMNVRPMIGDPKMFIWDQPRPEFWQSIFVEGDWENKDKDGNITKKSKNRLQEMCMAATNFDGSALQGMLDGLDGSLGDTGTAEKAEAPEEAPVETADVSASDEFAEMGFDE